MAEGVLGIAGGGSAALSQDVIDKLKEAESEARIAPIETKIETWDTEFTKMAEIKAANLDLIASFNDLTLDNTNNMFEKKSATTTGTAVSYDASDVSGLINGTTSVTVTQLAQKDVYQTGLITDTTALIDDGQTAGDMITIEVAGSPAYESTSISTNTSTDQVGVGEFTITPDGGDAITITTTDTTTWEELKDMINEDVNLTASFVGGRLSIAHADGETALIIADTSGDVTTDLGISRGRKFTTVDKSYENLATDINNNSKLNASVEQVGDSEYRLVIKSAESGTSSALTISQTGVDLNMNTTQTSTYFDSTSAIITDDASSIDIIVNGNLYTIDTQSRSLDDIKYLINNEATLNDEVLATVENGRLVLMNKESSTDYGINIVENNIDLGFSSAVVRAQNLNANIDGVAYDVSSNSITTQGSLTIIANELGDSSITISQDTGGILTSAQNVVEKYNTFVELVSTELNSTESSLQDKSALRLMQSSMKDILFSNYGSSEDKNIFSVGFSLDTSGFLSIDETTFNQAVSNDLEGLKTLFVGTHEDKGFATLLKTYTDALDGHEGALTNYDTNMTNRKTSLDAELLKETTMLDDKYALMAEEFAAYGALIATMEAQFNSLKMMIEQSVASN